MAQLIALDHSPGTLERNKDLSTQESYVTGPILRDNLASHVLYTQGPGLVKKGAMRHIQEDDIWRLNELNKARTLWESFEPYWQEELKNPKPSLRTAVFKRFKSEFIGSLGLIIAYSICTFINPVILPFLIDFVVDTSVPAYQGYIFVLCIILSQLVGSFCYHLSVFKGSILGIDLRSLISLLVYRKSLTMAPKKDLNTGQIINLVSGEAIFLADTIPYFFMGLSGPFQVVISVVLLGVYINFYLVILVGILAICLPVSLKLGKKVGMMFYLASIEADKRLKLTNELLQGIRIVKYYAWENAFKENVDRQREAELNKLSKLTFVRSLSLSLMQNIGSLGQGLTLVFYGLFGPGLTLSMTFTIVAIFNLVRQGFVGLPTSIVLGEMYLSTFKRIQEYIDEADIAPVPTTESEEARIKIDDATFQWGTASVPTLKNINLDAKKGDFVMVVGSVGSGKSSVVSAILGELAITSGSMGVSGSIAYVAQEAFIFNATVRENIIFGKPYDDEKYRRVLEASALMTDLAQFQAGDMTEIGERGVNLSGGQKQRISIARALYSDADIVLLDDPLSAVDSHVGKHLFQKAVRGYLADKLVILTANQLQYLPYADHIIFLHEGDVTVSGKFDELMQSNQQFKDQMIRFGVTGQNENESEEDPPVMTSAPQETKTDPEREQKSGTLVVDEDKAEGLIGLHIYWHYFKEGGLGVFFTIILFLALCVGARIVSGWWLSIWLSDGYSLSLSQYVGIYGGLMGADVVFFFVAALVDVSLSTRASRQLHRRLLSKVIRAPTSFFDITPMGRIINRFAKELNLIDTLLPIQLFYYLNSMFSMLAVLASMAFASPYLLIAIVAVVVAYYFFQLYFRKTYVETQRLEALSRAPIFSQLGETMRGSATIRAYKMEETFKNVSYWNIDVNSKHRFAQRYLISWFNLTLDAIGTGMVLILMVLIVSLRVTGSTAIQGGFAAFALANTAGLTPILTFLAYNAVEMEAKINSVERIKEYDTLEQEAPEVIKENRPPKNWPEKGEIVFKDASLRYRQGDLVLKRLNVKIDGEEKVGIVGRTGAGKSTLLQALFRIVELAEGSIEIDGIDISTIGLHDLRSKLSIIPQEPVLFLGTVRYNLDPFNEYNDRDIWETLAMVNLKSFIESLKGGLDAIVEENGSNFSVGQRQLMCMSRALLRKTKIFFMDEATASVDLDTDLLIQSMVRKNFSDRTSLTIAHRLNTVMDSTKILVLNRGELAEYGKPSDLLNDTNGLFTSMIEATGPDQSAYLKRIANGEVGDKCQLFQPEIQSTVVVVVILFLLNMRATSLFLLAVLGAAVVLAEVPRSTIQFKWVGTSSDIYNFNNWSCFVVSESGEKRCDTNDILNPFRVSTEQNVLIDASNMVVPFNLDLVQANEAKFSNGIFAVDSIETTKVTLDNANLIVKDQFKAEEVHIRSCEEAEQCTLEFDTEHHNAIQFESNPRVYGYGVVRFRKGLFLYVSAAQKIPRLTPNSVFQVSNVVEDNGLLDMSHFDPIRDENVGLSLYLYNSIEYYRAVKMALNGGNANSTSESCGTDHYYHRHMEQHFEEQKHRSVEQATCAPFGVLACDNPTTRDRYAGSAQVWTIGVVWHILSQSDGSQPLDSLRGFSIPDSLAALNDAFRAANIRFATREIRRIANSNFYTMRDSNVYFGLWSQYNSNRGLSQPRNIDIFIVNYPTTANGIINGEARFPWSRNPTINLVMAVRPGVVMRTFNTIAHEMGHVFGLWHTFQGSAWGCGNPCFEPVARNTADRNGDFCSDTRATPNNNQCRDPGTRDCTNVAFGATPFRNLMGYSPPNCRNQFSVQQRSRMRCFIQQTFPSIAA